LRRLLRKEGRLVLAAALMLAAGPAPAWEPSDLFAPCRGDCALAVYAGSYVEDSMSEILFTSPSPPTGWDYEGGDRLVAAALSRRAARLWSGRLTLEPEVGAGQRFGRQGATEIWGALFVRYHGFPWDDRIITTAAVSTGLNWADTVTGVERDRAKDGEGSHWMHFFAPEITFALPSRPGTELLLRFHHRSGVFGLVSDAWGGAQYATIGVRFRF
jgi:hypothetical protein